MRIKIVAGGQTGADRGGLDAAIELGIPHGGWCPKGRRAEDGAIPAIYKLMETKSADYRVRTEQNVVSSDATVIFTHGLLDGGSLLTANFAQQHDKPCLHIDLDPMKPDEALRQIVPWIKQLASDNLTLNVAGQRESKSPGIHTAVRQIMITLIKHLGVPK